jgi:hypothetical protein
MTLSDSELRAMRRTLAGYSDDKLKIVLAGKRKVMISCLEKSEDVMSASDPIMIRYEQALEVANCCYDEMDRRKAGKPIESLPGMEPVSTSTHTMNGR